MQRISVLKKAALAVTAATCVAGTAMAQSVTFNGFANGSQAVKVDLTPDSPFESYTLAAGGFSTSYNGASFVSYCVDLFEWLPSFGTANNSYSVVSGDSFFGSAKGADVSRLFSGFSNQVIDSVTSAAFQLALWEIKYETGSYDLTNGTAMFSAGADVMVKAKSFLDNLGSQTNSFQVSVLESVGRPGKQDVVFATPVPEPSTYALMIAGLLGVGYMARRRSKTQA